MNEIDAVERPPEKSRYKASFSEALSDTENPEVATEVSVREGIASDGPRQSAPMGKGVLVPVCGSCRIRVRAVAGEWKKEEAL